MTKQEFDEAVERLRREGRDGIKTEAAARVFVAASFVIRQRRDIPDGQPWGGPTVAELAEFLTEMKMDPVRRKRLKRIAEGLKRDVVGPAVPKTKH
jgi:hypothetical protein